MREEERGEGDGAGLFLEQVVVHKHVGNEGAAGLFLVQVVVHNDGGDDKAGVLLEQVE